MNEQKDSKRDKDGRFSSGATPEGAKPWQPGESGNPEGRPPNSVTTLLKNTDELTNQQIADMIIKKVLKGEYSFVKEYLDRTDGKVTDTHKILGDIPVTLIREPAKDV